MIFALQELLTANADPDGSRDPRQPTPLYAASQNGHTSIVRMLLNHKAAVNSRARDTGVSALGIAARQGHVEVVKLLCEGRFAFFCSSHPSHSLRTASALIDAESAKGSTPLYLASQAGHTACVELLLQHGAAVNKCNTEDGASPIFAASYKGHAAVVQILLEVGDLTP